MITEGAQNTSVAANLLLLLLLQEGQPAGQEHRERPCCR